MKSHALSTVGMFLLVGVLLFPFTVMGESLSAFTSNCEAELEIPNNSITGFTCNAGSVVLPTKQFGKECDAQALLRDVEERAKPGQCTSNSRLGVKSFSNPDVKAVWVCRKYAGIDNEADTDFVYHDIAMIVHNRKNGKTCFFQNKLDSTPIGFVPVVLGDGPVIPGPKDSNAATVWATPQGAAEGHCTTCHTNDPFIVTPHVAEAFRIFGMTRFNPNGLYSVVGEDFASFKFAIKKDPGCGGLCHLDPFSTFTNDANSKDWMPPGHRKDYTPYNFNPIPGQFYVLRSTGEVRGLNGPSGGACNNGVCPHWSILGDNPNMAEIAASALVPFDCIPSRAILLDGTEV